MATSQDRQSVKPVPSESTAPTRDRDLVETERKLRPEFLEMVETINRRHAASFAKLAK